jgi:cbb3-type cytochrome oxidase maturation protein
MEILFLTIGVSIIMALFFLGAFFWATKTGQYDDDHTPSVRILFEDEVITESNNDNKE